MVFIDVTDELSVQHSSLLLLMRRTSWLFSVPSSYFRSRDQAASVQRRCSSPVLPTAQKDPAFMPLFSKSGIRITLALGLM